MSSYKGETFLTRSTFLPPARVNNLSDAEKLFEEWIHSQDSDDNRRYKSLMLLPKNMNQMLVEARLRNQVEENEIGESGSINFEVDIPMETHNDSNICNVTLPESTTPQSHGNYQFIVDEDGMVDFRNGIKSRHNMIISGMERQRNLMFMGKFTPVICGILQEKPTLVMIRINYQSLSLVFTTKLTLTIREFSRHPLS